jgi:glutamate/tyrosine decarboxylase-like PLP-dependent enzyme
VASRTHRLAEHGPQLSRGFRALKIWMGLKEHGVDKLGRLIQQNVDQAAYLAERIRGERELELLAPAPLNVVCFRYRGETAGAGTDALNRKLLVRLHESGAAVPSHTVLRGTYALRVAITNHRTRRADLDLLVSEVVHLGRVLRAEAGEGR